MADSGETELRTEVQGIDNSGATEDDGTPVRPDLVISVQPTNGTDRAQLPVSTLDWRSNTRGQFIPVHGLDFLIGVSSLVIQQTVELTDLTSRIESENRYIVRIPDGEDLYIASEISSSTQRCLCGTGRAFTLHLHDNTRQEAMVFTRRLAAASCCFPCRLQEIQVVTPPGDYVGRVQQQCTWMVPFFLVRDANDQVLFVVEGPAVMQRSALLLAEFKIMTGDSLREVGKIAHGWDRDLNSFVTTVQVPAPAVQPKHKALILAAAFLLSLDWYNGHMLRDTMHGDGDYRWRYLGPDHLATTYEGRFYCNSMHGYGLMSYPDGRVFNGLFHKNIRWGPGVATHADLREDVGLWHGYQLIRLAWRPAVPSVAIDLVTTPIGVNTITPHRVLLTKNVKIIGELNSALELLKQSGCEPLVAANKWSQLYPKNCTDLSSQLCQVEAFDRAYYVNGISMLNEVTAAERDKDSSQSSTGINDPDKMTYYAWNNNKIVIHMMKHCFTHEEQRSKHRLSLEKILSGPRSSFKRAGKHEMDCRTLLMASYLGYVSNVATLVNECDVVPDVTDVQGNSAIMYAACGDQPETIHFLVEAGAEIDAYNDACCTPLGISLLRYALEKRGVAYNAMLQAVLPPRTAEGPPPPDESILEWKINRENKDMPETNGLTTGKLNHKMNIASKKNSAKELSIRRKTETLSKQDLQKSIDKSKDILASTDAFAEDKQMYDNINTEYLIRVAEAYSVLSEANPITYIFEVNDMCKDAELLNEDETKKIADSKSLKKTSSKTIKGLQTKPSRDALFQDKEVTIIDTTEQRKQEKMARIMLTILQLLSDGADPLKVRCPQPPLFIAAVSGCAQLIENLFMNGADINEIYPQVYGYTTLDIAVSGPLTNDNLEVIRALLECGADPNHRLKVPSQSLLPTAPTAAQAPDSMTEVEGPTLLHAVLARKIDSEAVDLRNRVLELLLQYGCDPIAQYKGRSAVEVALNKSLDLFDIFLKSPKTDLNAVINDANQTILVKMFYLPFCKTIPHSEKLQTTPKKVKSEVKPKKAVKATVQVSTGTKATGKQPGKIADDSLGDYRQAVDLVVECARLLYIRWLQAKLMKELIEVVHKYKHRHWTMILKEHKNKKSTSLWLTAVRGLEIWDILKTTKKKIYKDEKILKQVLCIIHFYFLRTNYLRCTSITKVWRRPAVIFQEKEHIENQIASFTREHRLTTMSIPVMMPGIRPYVTPELMVKEEEKFNVCFECIMPLGDLKIPCDSCNLIGFCSFECMKTNIDRINGHPCSKYLKEKYFLTPEETETNSEDII